ncbi:MAG: hypothetical protein IKQ22_00670 [Clostridia bacterium]|nr:hypothetical protein [Clostridia bacterium]
MARCKLTSMNLRTIRKSREYQALLIDLVAMGVVGQSTAEETLGYTIPAGLLDGDTPGPDPEPEAETPVITTDLPATKTISGSDTLEIVASVTDDGTLSYAWTKDGNVIPDATAATLTVNEAGTYQCTVTNTLGEDTATASSTACVVTAAASDTVTLLHFSSGEWKTAEYDLTDDPTGEGIIAFAKEAFDNSTINHKAIWEENPEYVEGTSELNTKYITADPQPEALEPGMLVGVYYLDVED